jgi:fumarate hydratase subunit beta
MIKNINEIQTPIKSRTIKRLKIGDRLTISGTIFTGRDAALPRLVKLIEKNSSPVDLEGGVIMHTAVSAAGIGPTSSNKTEIENSIAPLSKAGVKMHIGKGGLSVKTIEELNKNGSVFVVTPPATALLTTTVVSSDLLAFPEEGMEAFHRLEVRNFPAIVAVAHRESIY